MAAKTERKQYTIGGKQQKDGTIETRKERNSEKKPIGLGRELEKTELKKKVLLQKDKFANKQSCRITLQAI